MDSCQRGQVFTHLSTAEKLRSRDQLPDTRALDLKLDRPSVRPLHLLRGRQQQARERRQALQNDEHDVDRVRDLAGLARLGVQAQVDRTADQLAADAEGEPEAEEFALVVRLGVCERDGSLSLRWTC